MLFEKFITGFSPLVRFNLEAEAIHIFREVAAEAENPVFLYSVGKDSAVMLHLARKAFYPTKPPFKFLHVDTKWKFKEMITFRNKMMSDLGFDLLVHTNPDGLKRGINPFDHGSAMHTNIMKTVALKQVFDQYKFDIALGGARRDEEKSRAKERIFSFRTTEHRWDPKNQRPELWNIYNSQINKGESIRVFPMSNWTELDIWVVSVETHLAGLVFPGSRDEIIEFMDSVGYVLVPWTEDEMHKDDLFVRKDIELRGAAVRREEL